LHDLLRGEARSRNVARLAAPHGRDIRPVLVIGDVPSARQLLGLLAVFAPALTVALTGDHVHALPRPADATGREGEVDAGEHVLDALARVLEAARVQEHPGGRRSPELGGFFDPRRGHARDVGTPRRGVVTYRGRSFVETVGVTVDELAVEPVSLDQHVED